ncbi:matrixin family metalloprotease [Methanococcoides sp. FTZ1]|uniref:matrixin family metalloprotease n=1 Tax=Methanococcoides sp. FTZ1 TaxID=3439061 RepID=UPI003F878FA8
MNFRKAVITILLIIAIVTPGSALLDKKEYPKFLEEPWDHTPITVYIDEKNTPPHYSPSYPATVIKALEYWENGGNGKLSYTPVFEPVNTTDADIYIMWVENMEEVTGAEKGVAGFCRPMIANGRYVHADIVLEVGDYRGFSWQQYGDANMEQLVTHEIGHALGLGHSNDPRDIMYPTYEQRENIDPLLVQTTYPLIIIVILMAIAISGYLSIVWLRYHRKRQKLEHELLKK